MFRLCTGVCNHINLSKWWEVSA